MCKIIYRKTLKNSLAREKVAQPDCFWRSETNYFMFYHEDLLHYTFLRFNNFSQKNFNKSLTEKIRYMINNKDEE